MINIHDSNEGLHTDIISPKTTKPSLFHKIFNIFSAVKYNDKEIKMLKDLERRVKQIATNNDPRFIVLQLHILKSSKQEIQNLPHQEISTRRELLLKQIEQIERQKENIFAGEQLQSLLGRPNLPKRLTPQSIQLIQKSIGLDKTSASYEDLDNMHQALKHEISISLKKLTLNKGDSKQIHNHLHQLHAGLREVERQSELYCTQQLKAAPRDVQRSFHGFQNLIGKNYFIPFGQRVALLRLMQHPTHGADFKKACSLYIKQMQEIKTTNTKLLSEGMPTITDAQHNENFLQSYSFLQTKVEGESLFFGLSKFQALLKAKIGTDINIQSISDTMSLAVAGCPQPKGAAQRHLYGMHHNSQIAPYLSTDMRALAKNGFMFQPAYCIAYKNEWIHEPADGHLNKLIYIRHCSHQQADGSFGPSKKTKEITFDFAACGLTTPEQQSIAWSFITECVRNSTLLPLSASIDKIPITLQRSMPNLTLNEYKHVLDKIQIPANTFIGEFSMLIANEMMRESR